MKIVINTCYGGFSISKECAELMAKKGCPIAKAELEQESEFYGYGYVEGSNGYDRTSKFLVEAVEELGEKANTWASRLKVVEIPDGVDYYIDEYDGIESVHQTHESWG